MALDTPTLIVAAVAAMGLMAIAQLVAWSRSRSETAILWVVGASLSASLAALLRVVAPENAAIVVANIALYLSLACIGTACRAFGGRRPNAVWFVGPPLAWTALCCFPAVFGDQQLRVVIASAIVALYVAWAIDELWQDRAEALAARRFLLVLLGLHGIGAFGRMVATELHRGTPQPGLVSDASIALVVLWSLGFTLLFGFAMILAVHERAERRLHRSAGEDALTGLANRRHFDLALATACRQVRQRPQPVALILFDVDAFKAYNDTHGHLAGDACLQTVADVLRTTFSATTSIVARFGGEEFAVLVPAADAALACALTEIARRRLYDVALPHGGCVLGRVTISAGVCAMPARGGADERDLLLAADRALYAAKRQGRNRFSLERLGRNGEAEQPRLRLAS